MHIIYAIISMHEQRKAAVGQDATIEMRRHTINGCQPRQPHQYPGQAQAERNPDRQFLDAKCSDG
jgi:hypothetical protein